MSSLGSHSTARERVTSVAILLLVTLVVFGPLSLHPGNLLVGPQRSGRNDLSTAFLAYHSYPGVAWSRFGDGPYWNPYSQCGRPWAGNPQAALYYPFNWLPTILNDSATAGWLLVLHHCLAGVGVFFLCRHFGLRQGAALIGGITFLAAPYYIAHTGEGHWNQVCLVAWVPWTLLSFERLRKAQPGALPCTALLLALTIICGHAQESVYLLVILSTFVLADVGPCLWKGQAGAAGGAFLRWAGTVLLAMALAAIELIPNWIYLQQCTRGGGVDATETNRFCLGLANLQQLLNPLALGPPDDYRGPGEFYWETVCYFGLVPCVLACVAIAFTWRRYPVQRMTWLFVLSLVFAFGPAGGIYSLVVSCVPMVGMFRVSSRALFFASLAVAVLAAVGGDWLYYRVAARYALRLRKLPFMFVCGLVLLCVGDLSHHAWRVVATVPPSSIRANNPVSVYLQQHAGLARVVCSQELLSDREAWAAGLQKAQGYEPVPLVRYMVAMDATAAHSRPELEATGFSTPRLDAYHKPALDMLGVRFLVTDDPTPAKQDGWRLVAHGQLPGEFTLRGCATTAIPYFLWENTSALPRAYVVGRSRVAPSDMNLVTALRMIDPRREVLLDADVLPAGPRSEFMPAEITDYTATHVAVDLELAHPGYLVLSDVWYPGWRAEDNGRRVPILLGNGAFRAIPLQAGPHRVVFRYSTPLFKLAAWISSVALIAMVFSQLRPLYRSRMTLAGLTGANGDSETRTPSPLAPG